MTQSSALQVRDDQTVDLDGAFSDPGRWTCTAGSGSQGRSTPPPTPPAPAPRHPSVCQSHQHHNRQSSITTWHHHDRHHARVIRRTGFGIIITTIIIIKLNIRLPFITWIRGMVSSTTATTRMRMNALMVLKEVLLAWCIVLMSIPNSIVIRLVEF